VDIRTPFGLTCVPWLLRWAHPTRQTGTAHAHIWCELVSSLCSQKWRGTCVCSCVIKVEDTWGGRIEDLSFSKGAALWSQHTDQFLGPCILSQMAVGIVSL
jgi:hypothetical protein